MKTALVLLFIFFISIVSALPAIELQKENYQAQETLIGTISGTTSNIVKEDIRVYQERRELSLDKEVFNYNNTYYFYIILSQEGTFRIEIDNLLYSFEGTLQSANIKKEVIVQNNFTENKTQILGIRPGIINSYYENVTLYITNFGSNQINVKYLSENISLIPGKSQKIDLKLNDSFSNLIIDTYFNFSIPLIYRGSTSANLTLNETKPTKNETETFQTVNITSNINKLVIKSVKNEEKNYSFNLINIGKNVSNLKLKSKNALLSIQSEISNFESNTLKEINFSINYNNFNSFNETILITENNLTIFELPVEVYIFENETASNLSNLSSQIIQKSCVSIGGIICTENENCEGDFTYADGLCCFGSCKAMTAASTNPLNVLFGIGIIGLVIFAVYYFYKKIKNVKVPTAEERMRKMEKGPAK